MRGDNACTMLHMFEQFIQRNSNLQTRVFRVFPHVTWYTHCWKQSKTSSSLVSHLQHILVSEQTATCNTKHRVSQMQFALRQEAPRSCKHFAS